MSTALVVAGIVLLAVGLAVLALDARRSSAGGRARRQWAQEHGGRHQEADPALAGWWRHGVFADSDAGRAVQVVSLVDDGRPVHLFDLQRAGATACTVLAVRRPSESEVVLELRQGSVSTGSAGLASGLDLLGPVGERYAFTNDLEAARAVVDDQLVELVDAAGYDLTVLWVEGGWALAALDPTAGPERWDDVLVLLGRLGELAHGLPATQPV
ncbi:hypothetical protein [Rhodococcus sp. X156]|uniref:hypothetical protein n=1 Tax=Rhodococcus sp. X156 TaxID=2499145 RepID=UPI000FDCB4C0|nr:hypothetical protein [Rhodococcus sp. X156]